MPIRNRGNSSVARLPNYVRQSFLTSRRSTRPHSQPGQFEIEIVTHHHQIAELQSVEVDNCRTERPLSFIYVWGAASRTFSASEVSFRQHRIEPQPRLAGSRVAWTTRRRRRYPTLCRVRSYFGPGFPSPTDDFHRTFRRLRRRTRRLRASRPKAVASLEAAGSNYFFSFFSSPFLLVLFDLAADNFGLGWVRLGRLPRLVSSTSTIA